jgi:hypothetical protein
MVRRADPAMCRCHHERLARELEQRLADIEALDSVADLSSLLRKYDNVHPKNAL